MLFQQRPLQSVPWMWNTCYQTAPRHTQHQHWSNDVESPDRLHRANRWWLQQLMCVSSVVTPREGVACSEQQVFPQWGTLVIEPVGLGGLQQGAWRRRPAHTQTIHFAPTARKVVNLPGLLKTKGLNLIVKRANYENGPANKWWWKASKRCCNKLKSWTGGHRFTSGVSLENKMQTW